MTNDESLNGSSSPGIAPPVAFPLDEHLEFIDIIDDRSSNAYLLLSASNLVKEDWTGGLWYYSDPELAPRAENASASMQTHSANAAGELINHEKCMSGDDEGTISIYQMNKNSHQFQLEHFQNVSHSYITSLSLSPSKSKAIIASAQSLSLFDNEVFVVTRKYPGAHVKKITCVHWGPHEDTFVTTSVDKTAILWDLRQIKPALAIYEDEIYSLKSASWLNSNEVAFGSLSGEILSVDIRSLSTSHKVHFLKKPVHKLRSNPNTGALAACFDSNHVMVFNDKFNRIYTNESHKDIVRGLAWHPLTGQLYSCGYSSQIIRHEIP